MRSSPAEDTAGVKGRAVFPQNNALDKHKTGAARPWPPRVEPGGEISSKPPDSGVGYITPTTVRGYVAAPPPPHVCADQYDGLPKNGWFRYA